MNPSLRSRRLRPLMIMVAVLALLGGLLAAPAAKAADRHVTNTAHLDFLLDEVTLPAVAGHTTYRLAQDPTAIMPWTYADARPGNTFERIGGGPKDAATGHFGQGAFNADDIARTAVVYLRHWKQFNDTASRDKAYELLRSVAYLQTTTGPNRGNVVLWIQSDGTLNPSAEPVELPDPSDSGESYWLARSIWAFGEGYAAFVDEDPAFARFLADRLTLATDAVDRQVLKRYGKYRTVDGRKVPAWLIVNGADATAEATLGWSAYLQAKPSDRQVRTALRKSLEGIAGMSTDRGSWPYGAVQPWAESRSIWHAWSSQMAAGLASGADALGDRRLLQPAIKETTGFDPVLLTSGGPMNGWNPTPTDKVQIAYGVDSRVQSLLAVADVANLPGLRELAAANAGWYFGANRAGRAMYDPATGIAFDGLQPDGGVNVNSGAESTIHALLSMLALDAHPPVREKARSMTGKSVTHGLTMVEAETATGGGTVVTPASGWTGESSYSGDVLRLAKGDTASLTIPGEDQARRLEPVSWLVAGSNTRTRWTVSGQHDTITHRVGNQGISAVPGALLPQPLKPVLRKGDSMITMEGRRGAVDLDGVLVRPMISRAAYATASGGPALEVLASADTRDRQVAVTVGPQVKVRSYTSQGKLVANTRVGADAKVLVAKGGFTVIG